MDFVIDCSVAAAFFLPDEQEEFALSILDSMTAKKAVVPALFHWEIANVFYVANKRGRCSTAQISQIVSNLAKLPIFSDNVPDVYEINELFTLCQKYSLSAYDCSYLRTAKRYNVPLITLDKSLKSAAEKEGILVSI